MPTPSPSPPHSQDSAFLPIVMIVLGVALLGFSWFTSGPSQTTQIENLISQMTNTNPATPTTLVVVVPNGAQKQAPAAPAAQAAPLPAAPAAQAQGPVWVSDSNPVNEPAPSGAAQSEEVFPTAAPVITVTATLVEEPYSPTAAPIITVTATLAVVEPSISPSAQNMGGHCSQWANDECAINPTATAAPTYVPPTALPTTITASRSSVRIKLPPTLTPLPPTPTITPTPLPENNSVKSLVTRQGAISHGGTEVLATNSKGVVAHATTDANGEFSLSGLDKGSYQLAAYSPNGSHLPACKEVTIGGNESIVIPQTMLSNGGGFNTDEKMNIGAAALVAIQLGLTIPEHMVPILDVNNDQEVDQADANMLIANPKLLACQQW